MSVQSGRPRILQRLMTASSPLLLPHRRLPCEPWQVKQGLVASSAIQHDRLGDKEEMQRVCTSCDKKCQPVGLGWHGTPFSLLPAPCCCNPPGTSRAPPVLLHPRSRGRGAAAGGPGGCEGGHRRATLVLEWLLTPPLSGYLLPQSGRWACPAPHDTAGCNTQAGRQAIRQAGCNNQAGRLRYWAVLGSAAGICYCHVNKATWLTWMARPA